MAIRRGHGTIQRRHASNYIGKQADARLQEIIQPAQQKGLEALKVDSFEVMYYRRASSSLACSCQRVAAPPLMDHNLVNPPGGVSMPGSLANHGNDDEEITIDHMSNLFGTENTMGEYNDNIGGPGLAMDSDFDEEIHEDDDDGRSQSSLFALSTDCGICYRHGLVPGYELYGHDRKLLLPANVEDTAGYHVDTTKAPHKFVAIDEDEGYVEFQIEVPKYFQKMRYSVRNNTDHMADEPLYAPNGMPLTMQMVRLAAAGVLTVRVRALEFTHVAIDFDLGVEPIRAALAQDTKATDWTLFDTLGTLSMILPMTISSVETSDVLYVPMRGYTFKISDVTYLRTARNKNMDWQVQARVLQPQEGLKRIYQAVTMR